MDSVNVVLTTGSQMQAINIFEAAALAGLALVLLVFAVFLIVVTIKEFL